MTWQDCANRVEQGDYTRFAATMIAPVAVRATLFPIYAFNLELADAAWASPEPLICHMRLQFWADALSRLRDGQANSVHPVAEALAKIVKPSHIDRLETMVTARRREVDRSPIDGEAALVEHLSAMTGTMMELAFELLGGTVDARVRDIAAASALANWVMAAGRLEARGIAALPDARDDAIADLAGRGLRQLAAVDQRSLLADARPAIWPAFLARTILTRAAQKPHLVRAGLLAPTPLYQSLVLLGTRLAGRV